MVDSTRDTLPAHFMWLCLKTSSVATPQHHREADGRSMNKETRHPILFQMLECVCFVDVFSKTMEYLIYNFIYEMKKVILPKFRMLACY